ncbi:MAG: DUF4190 domain-containing protein [Phoenicibacter congonensis]|uniref:DUF4190 domain-containing protein n=1 Tax=Phoenicibacter congonensis TaxID=1944646 RepID=A0AA43RHT2_9ACTN|nr:DUF4190 domain-containing protein [Phoenicibacter congonensis]
MSEEKNTNNTDVQENVEKNEAAEQTSAPAEGASNQENNGSEKPVGTAQIIHDDSIKPEKKFHGLAIAAMIVGIVSLVFSFIPILHWFFFFAGLAGLILGIVGLVLMNKDKLRYKGKGMAIAGIVTSALAMVLVVLSTVFFVNLFVINSDSGVCRILNDEYTGDGSDLIPYDFDDDQSSLNSTDESEWSKYCQVDLGTFTVSNSEELKVQTTKLPVKITNLGSSTKTYILTVKALDSNGDEIAQDGTVVVNLAAGKSTTTTVFTYLDDDTIDKLQSATFKVAEVDIV